MEKYLERHFVKTYECGETGEMRLHNMLNVLEAMATTHAESLGVGPEALAEKGGFWVFTGYDIRIRRLPMQFENVILKTWPSQKGLLTTDREIQIADENDVPLVDASARFAIVDKVRQRPCPVAKFFPENFDFLNERAVDTDFPHVAPVERGDISKPLAVRCDDIDQNHHVNNSVYLVWAEDVLPVDFRKAHTPVSVRIEYKKSAVLNDSIVSKVVFDGDSTRHAVVSGDDGREFARAQIKWAEKPVV